MAEINVETKANTKSTPPRKADTPNTQTAAKVQVPQTVKEQRADAVDGIFQLVGLGCIIVGQYADAGAISVHSPPISIEVAEMAEKNEGVAKAVDSLLQVGPYAGLVAVVMPLVLQLLANHKIVPAEKFANANVVKPEILESQVKTNMARQAMEALQAQASAEEELAAMRREMQESGLIPE
jgi:hypothetical protein